MSEAIKSNRLNIIGNILHISRTLKKEFFRKSIHMLSAFIPFLYFFSRPMVLIGLLFVTLLYFISEVLRYKGVKIPLISTITELASRTRDEGKIVLGPITLTIGIFVAFTLFDYRTATLATLALSFGDGVASLFGKLIGGVKIPFTFGKTLSGTTGCFLVLCFVFFLCGLNLWQILIISAASSLIEALPRGDFDNLILPVSVGLLIKFLII